MENQVPFCRPVWKCALVCLIVTAAGLFQTAECNYEALYDYEREKHVDTHAAYIVENEVQKIDLQRPIHFYGQEYSRLQVSEDGTVSFGRQPVTFTRNPQWPQGFTELTSASDRPFIAAFHHDGYASNNPQSYHGRMYWSKYERQKEAVSEDTRRQDSFLTYLGKYLSHSSVTVETFQPDLYVIVTWENVTDHATKESQDIRCNADHSSPCPSATFQIVITADSKNTFVILNYAKMDLNYSDAQLAGMNGGRGRGWTGVVKCDGTCRKNKVNRQIPHLLPTLQGSSSEGPVPLSASSTVTGDVLGRFIFVVTDDVVVRGGCLPHDEKVAGYMDTVEVYPHQVQMLGGQIIQVSGQCQAPFSTIYCRFDSRIVTEGKISAGMVGWCPVPHLTQRGLVRLEVSSSPSTWRVYTHILVLPPDHLGLLSEDRAMHPWFEVEPTQLTVSWNKSQLTHDTKATVDIVLVQYLETGGQVKWKDLTKLAEATPNTGTFTFNPYRYIDDNDIDIDDPRRKMYMCVEDCDDIHVGLLEIRLTVDYLEAATERQFIPIGPLPLAWYVNRAKKEVSGREWYKTECEAWASKNDNQKWLTDLPPCPCTLQQALADWGRWQPDVDCNPFRRSTCRANQGAKLCVSAVHPTPLGAGGHCCYDNHNNLMYAADSYEGSTSSRSEAWGAAPYNTPGTVPAMSHWLHDLMPHYYCCLWTDRDYCQLYTDRRPTKDCREYNPPGSAIMFGDPHVITFDDERYHFGGAGDFWLVQSPGLSVQARFLERQTSTVTHKENFLQPTYMSCVAVRGAADSDTVTFAMAPPGDIHPRRLDVMVNQRHYFFEKDLFMWQDFNGVSVVNNQRFSKSQEDSHHANFTVLVKNGAAMQVTERDGLLNVVVVLPPLVKENGQVVGGPASKGLLGSWDEKKTNEYMQPNGEYVPRTEDDFVKYKNFAKKWAVESSEQSLFQFNHPASDRVPFTDSISTHIDPDLSPNEGEVSATCGSPASDFQNPCVYDYFVTGNHTVAISTKNTFGAFESLRHLQKKVWSCGWLDIPFAIKDHSNYSVGNTVVVTGCRQGLGSTGQVNGHQTEYTCIQEEREQQPAWEPEEISHTLCTDPAEDAAIGMIIGIVVAVIFVIAVAVVVVFFLVKKRKSGTQSVKQPKASARDEAAMDPGTDETLMKQRSQHRGDRYTSRERESSRV